MQAFCTLESVQTQYPEIVEKFSEKLSSLGGKGKKKKTVKDLNWIYKCDNFDSEYANVVIAGFCDNFFHVEYTSVMPLELKKLYAEEETEKKRNKEAFEEMSLSSDCFLQVKARDGAIVKYPHILTFAEEHQGGFHVLVQAESSEMCFLVKDKYASIEVGISSELIDSVKASEEGNSFVSEGKTYNRLTLSQYKMLLNQHFDFYFAGF